jgi:hypothetical protein
MQMAALEDWSVTDKLEWDAATKFLEVTLQNQLNEGTMNCLLRVHSQNLRVFCF